MSEQDYQTYLQSAGATLTATALLVSFIFSTLTLVLVELEDVTSLASQASLLVLVISYLLASLRLAILHARMEIISRIHRRTRLPKTPGTRFQNLLILMSMLLLGVSIVLMFFVRELIYLGSLSAVLLGLSFLAYLIYVLIPQMKTWEKGIQAVES